MRCGVGGALWRVVAPWLRFDSVLAHIFMLEPLYLLCVSCEVKKVRFCLTVYWNCYSDCCSRTVFYSTSY